MATPFFHVDVQQPAEMRFNRARVRRAFVTIGQRHMRDARRLVMRRARSAPGKNPGYHYRSDIYTHGESGTGQRSGIDENC
ncbi:TPA: hypothetical protein ACRZHF_003590 [Escherichia coli]